MAQDFPPSPEFRLATSLACWPLAAPLPQGVEFRWDEFLRIVKRHRVAGLVNRTIGSVPGLDVPDHVRAILRRQAQFIAGKNLQLAAESLRIQARMTASGVDAAFLKGAALAVLIHGDVGARHSNDIDLLVPARQLDAAIAVLAALGYGAAPPGISAARRAWVRNFGQHIQLWHDRTGILVELHCQTLASPLLVPPPHPGGWVEVSLGGGGALRTLAGDDHLLYLFVHGARHAWFRFKWLVDIVHMTAGWDEAALRQFVQFATDRQWQRPVAQGLLLSASLSGARLPVDLLLSDRAVPKLCKMAERAMTTPGEPDTEPFLETRIRFGHYGLRHGFRYVLSEMTGHLIAEKDWATLSLPTPLVFLYPILRLPFWLSRKIAIWRRDRAGQRSLPALTDSNAGKVDNRIFKSSHNDQSRT